MTRGVARFVLIGELRRTAVEMVESVPVMMSAETSTPTAADGGNDISDGCRYKAILVGGRPWGFRLQGGFEFAQRIRIAKVKADGKAAKQGVRAGDLVMTINGCDTEKLTLNDALKKLQDASTENEGGFQLELVRANRSATRIAIDGQLDNATCRPTSTTTGKDYHREKKAESRSDDNQSSPENHVTVESHVTMAAYSVHSLDRQRDTRSTSKTPPPTPSMTSSSSALWSPKGHRSMKTFQPVRFDLTAVSGPPTGSKFSSAEISPLPVTLSGSVNQFPPDKRRHNSSDAYAIVVDNTKKSNYSWRPSSMSPDRGRREVTNSATESVLRGFRGLRDFWLSPKLSRKSIDDDDDRETDTKTTTPNDSGAPLLVKPADVVKLSSLPHVLEQPSPAEEVPLPANVPRFTMEEFTKVFGPCRLAFSLPASPLRRKRLSASSNASSTTENDVTMAATYGGNSGEVGSASTTPNMQRRVTFRLDNEGDSSLDRDSVGEDGGPSVWLSASAVAGQPQNRGNQPNSVRELSRLRGMNTLRSIRESLPLDSTVSSASAADKSNLSRPSISADSGAGGSADAASKYGTNPDGRTVKSSARIKLVASPVTVCESQQQQQQQPLRPSAASSGPINDSLRQPQLNNNNNNNIQSRAKDSRFTSLNAKPNLQNGSRSTLSKNGSASLPRNLESSLLKRYPDDVSSSTLPTVPDPLITLLSAGRGQKFTSRRTSHDTEVTAASSCTNNRPTFEPRSTSSCELQQGLAQQQQHAERGRESSVVSTDGTCTPGPSTPNSEHSDRFRANSSAAVSEDEDLTYRDWYRKVFSTLHRTNPDSDEDEVVDQGENIVIPRRPSVSKINDKPHASVSAASNGRNSTTPREFTESSKSSSLPRDTRICVKSTKSKSLDGTALKSQPTPPNGETHRAVQKFELEVSAKIAAEKNRQKKDATRHQATKLNGVGRSMQEPCKIVKPEDNSLYSDEYWIEFAKELDRERLLPTMHSVISDENRSPRNPLPRQNSNRPETNEENRVLKLSQKFVIAPHQYDTTPFVKPRRQAVSTSSTENTRSTVGKAKAIYTFVASDNKEMSFCRGDVIDLVRQVDKNWYEGRMGSRRGLVPSNYIELVTEKREFLDLPEDVDRDVRVVALHNFTAKTADELSIRKGDVLTVTRTVDENWYEGRMNGRQGMFPVNHVERLSEVDCLSQTTSSIQDQMSSPPSDTDLSHSSLPNSSLFRDRVDAVTQSFRRPEPSRYGGGSGGVTTGINSSFRQQPPPSTSTASRHPHKEQLFVTIGSNGDGADVFDDIGVPKNSTPSGSLKRVKFNDARPLTASTRDQSRDNHGDGGQRSGFIPPQQELRNNTTLFLTVKNITKEWKPVCNDPTMTTDRRRVLYDYEPRHDDELALREGDLVTVIRCFDDGWCVGMLNRTKKIGTFPGNYLV